MTEKYLSDKEVKKLAGKDSKVVLYPEIQNYNNLDELFGNKNKVIILYLNESTPTRNSGHWCGITRRFDKKKKKEIVEYLDSYGQEIDQPLEFNNSFQNKELNQEHGYLSRLLYDYCNGNDDDVELHYNELPMQKHDPDIATCGRHLGLRMWTYPCPLEQYQKLMKNMENSGFNLDEVVTLITDKLLK